MKNIFEAVIKRGDFHLETMLEKIDKYHIEGKLTDSEREELYVLANNHTKKPYDYEAEINNLREEINELRAKIEAKEE